MVFEFPELQGVMGGIYAEAEGEPEEVWKAIYHQCLPVGVEADSPPDRIQLGAATISWTALSLADKLDTVAGLSIAGERLSGSRDPFGLRRQLQGIVRILVDLHELTGLSAEPRIADLVARAGVGFGVQPDNWLPTVLADYAVAERARHLFRTRGFDFGELNAVVPPDFDGSPRRARLILSALQTLRGSEDLHALAILFKRVKNITKETATGGEIDRDALAEPAERALLEQIDARRPRVDAAVGRSDYRGAFAEIAGLRAPVDRFFTEVFVMAEDARLRSARLALMASLRDLVLHLADISEIIPQTE